MEGKAQKASRIAPTQKAVGGPGTLTQEAHRPEATPTSGQTMVTIPLELLQKIMQSALPGTDLALLLAQAGVVSTPPPIAGPQEQGTHGGEPASREAETRDKEAETQESKGAGPTEADPDSTVAAGSSKKGADDSKASSDVVGHGNEDEVSHPEKVTDLTMGSEGKDNSPKRVEEGTDTTSTERGVVNLTGKGERTG